GIRLRRAPHSWPRRSRAPVPRTWSARLTSRGTLRSQGARVARPGPFFRGVRGSRLTRARGSSSLGAENGSHRHADVLERARLPRCEANPRAEAAEDEAFAVARERQRIPVDERGGRDDARLRESQDLSLLAVRVAENELDSRHFDLSLRGSARRGGDLRTINTHVSGLARRAPDPVA